MTESFNTTGQIRSEVIYVPWKIRKSLGYVAQAQGTTREALAEAVLSEWLAANHPSIGEWLDKRQSEEREFQRGISNIPFSKPACPADKLLKSMAQDAAKPFRVDAKGF